MLNDIVEHQVEAAFQDAFGDKAMKLMKGLSAIASKQGGANAVENYKLLGQRALIVAGVAIVVVNVASWAVGSVISRRLEEKRIEQTVRRVLAEEREKEYTEVSK